MMAAVGASPSGFSYAQAAKGRSPAVAASQAGSSKVTSGAATPATGTSFTELTPGSNWADDVEASVGEKAGGGESQKPAHETGRSGSGKESAVERAKSEDKAQNSTSGISSPDLAASTSTTTKDDDSSNAATNGTSSETTWETKSQASEPAWIAERKERQSSSQNSDSTVRGEKKSKEASLPPPPKPVVLHEAPPPSINIWAKRAEEAKAKATVVAPQPRPTPSPPSKNMDAPKENQRPKTDSRKKANSVSSVPQPGESPFGASGEQRKPGSSQGKRGSEVRTNHLQQSSKLANGGSASAGQGKVGIPTRSSLPNITTAPPPVKDDVSWPTPETATDKEQKDLTEKPSPEPAAEEETPTNKPRQKTQWKAMAVTPNIVWQTQNVKGLNAPPRGTPSGERASRGGSLRGRGGMRGGASGSNGGERAAQRGQQSQSEDDGSFSAAQRGRSDAADREAMPPPPKPSRTASAGSRKDYPAEARQDRSVRGNSLTEIRSSRKSETAPSEEQKAVSSWVEAQSSMPRTKSPGQVDNATSDPKDTDRIPEPIPRRSSVGTQTETTEAHGKSARDAPPIRLVPSDGRKEPRAYDNSRETNLNGTTRGAKRNGRGRGGSREFANGHQASHAHGNGDIAGAPYGVPPSPSGFTSTRGNHYTFPSQGRGGWRSNPRAGSLPMEGYYGRSGYGYGPPVQPMPTYIPGMYDYAGYPMSAMPYQPMMEQQYLYAMVSMQMEYYFSIDNLLKDMFLRKNMDSQGFVLLDVVASFNRLKQLTQDRNILKEVCLSSETIEIKVGDDGKERLRRREGYEQFVLEMKDRESAAQNDGPQQLHSPEKPAMHVFGSMPTRGPSSAGGLGTQSRYDRRSYDSGYTMNGVPPQFANFPTVPETGYGEMMNGDDVRGRAAKSPIREDAISPPSQTILDSEKDSEPDAFPDDQASMLTVVVKVKDAAPFHSATSRTFSNGSIDSRSIFGELEKANAAQPITNGETAASGADSSASASRHVSPNKADTVDRNGPAPEMLVWWMKDQSAPSGSMPSEALSEPYTQLRYKALDQRNHAATGTCPYDLDVLYQFWSTLR